MYTGNIICQEREVISTFDLLGSGKCPKILKDASELIFSYKEMYL
jgi:hypothetical protein